MGELDKEIAQLETLLRRLEKEYDQFLSGQQRREPAETESAVIALVRGLSARAAQSQGTAFKFNAVVARYNAFKTVWQRRVREKEEGRTVVPAQRAVRGKAAPPPRGPMSTARPAEQFVADPQREGARLRELYETYRQLREECGESTDRLQEESFRRTLAEKIESIKRAKGCDKVLVRIVKEEGRTRIVAKPVRGEGGAGPGGGP